MGSLKKDLRQIPELRDIGVSGYLGGQAQLGADAKMASGFRV